MEIKFNVEVSVGTPYKLRYLLDTIHDYVWEGEDEDE